jgi:hypothetical protein
VRRMALAVALALSVSGCGDTSPSPVAPLKVTMAGMHDGTFVSARLNDGILTLRPGDLGPDRNSTLFRVEWEADVISHAIAVRQIRAHQESVIRYDFVGPGHHLVTGQEVTPRGFNGFHYRGKQIVGPRLWQDSDFVIKQRVTAAMSRFGVTPRSIRVLRPLGPAVVAAATVPDGKVDWQLSDLTGAAFDPGLEGYLLELFSPSGRQLAAACVAARSRTGGVRFAPGQDERFGITHGGMPHLDSSGD